MKRFALSSAAFAMALATTSAAQLKGLWEFEDASNITKATTGNNLIIGGTAPAHSASLADDSARSLSGVITTRQGPSNFLRALHNIPANGGGTYVNRYSIVVDVFSPVASRSAWRALYQAAGTATQNDGEYFIRNTNDTLGVAEIGYSSTAIDEKKWTRLVFTVDLAGSSKFNTYLDGTLIHTHTGTAGVDGRFSLYANNSSNGILFFSDNDNENAPLNIGTLAIYDGTLTAAEVSSLGAAGAPIGGNGAPVISEGSNRSLETTKNGAAVSLTFHATDPDQDPITWSITGPPAHGTATLTAGSNSECTISYLPDPGYAGVDSYTVQASDGTRSATSEVSVVVTDPSAPPYPSPVGWWQFDHDFDPTVATIGRDLGSAGSGFSFMAGNGTGDGSVQVSPGSHYIIDHGIPGGTGSGTKVNEYTVLFDVLLPSNGWKTLYQTDPANTSDGDVFIDTANKVGCAAMGGYSSNSLSNNRWYRIVVSVDNGTSRKIYVNGQLWLSGNAGALDDRYALSSRLLALADENGEDGLLRISNLALWSSPLNAAQVAALGGAGAFIIDAPPATPNHAPVITEGSTTSANTGMAVPTPFTFHATDADDDTIAWSISKLPANGNAVVTANDNGQCQVIYTSSSSFTGSDTFTLKAADAKASDSIVVTLQVQNSAPAIAEGENYLMGALKNGGPRTAVFTATDANANTLTWSIGSEPAHGTASIATTDSTVCEVSYTPDADYVGPDSFSVEVTDGLATDSILVTVMVSDPNADPVLTVISPFGNPDPPVGNHSAPAGTSFAPSVSDEVAEQTRHHCVGWTMTGDGPQAGTGNSFSTTLTRNSTLTWLWRTEHRIQTAVSGNGTIDLPSGWYDAALPVQITATPAPGYYFSGWTGDTSGCTMGGKSIVIPMDRPRDTITANFTSNDNFSVIAFPDTQNYTSISSPADTFTRQARWVVDNKDTLNIKFLTHLGDIVNSPTSSSQWTRATNAMNLLNSQLAYGTCPGNHDLASGSNDYINRFGPNPVHASSVGRWIDPATNQSYDWYRGSSPRGYSSYQIVPINGREFMFLHLDHDCPDEDMAWAASVLSAHPRTLTMITTHNYLAETGGNGIFGSGTGERGYTAGPNVTIGPDRNRPEEVFNALVKPFNQVYMVICGHMFAIYNLEKINAAGNVVHEVLCDYQSLPNGGNGFLRIMEFRPSENKIYNSTFSPTLGRYIDPNLPADRQGMLDLHNPNGGEFVIDVNFDHRFDSNLQVASVHNSVSPAVGTHRIADGTPIVISASDKISGQTRNRPVGWTLSGKQNLSGSGHSATITHQGNSTLTWTWSTEYLLATATTGDGLVSIGTGWQTAGTTVSIVAQPDPGATFSQWSGDIAGCTVNGDRISVPMDRPRGPITAGFSSSLPTFPVQVVSAFASTTPAPATYFYEAGSAITFSAADLTEGGTRRVCTGYTVSGATEASGPGNQVTLNVTGNLILTWHWKTEYLVQAAASGPGTVDPTSAWVGEGASITLTGTPEGGAQVASWTGDTTGGVANGATFSIAAVNRPMGPITANFALGLHTLTIVSSEDSVVPAVGTISLPHGSTVEFSATPKVDGSSRAVPSGWAIAGEQATSGTTPTGSFVILADTTLTWSWNREVYLSVSSGLEGRVLPLDAAGWKPLGSQVSLETIPAEGYRFVRWNGDVSENSTSPSLVLSMDQPRSLTADVTPAKTAFGTPHWWLDTHANVINGDYEAADLADSDGDGQTARAEFITGTDDRDPARRFQVQKFQRVSSSALGLTWQSDVRRSYVITSSPDLASGFSPFSGPIAGKWPATSTEIPKPGTRHFYRVDATLPAAGPLDSDSIALNKSPDPASLQRQMSRIPAGWFTRGDNGGVQDTKPAHLTYVPGFEMDRLEVTRADWEKVATWARSHGYDLSPTLPYNVEADEPAVAMTWYDAVKWCNARSEMEGRIPVYHSDLAGLTVYRSGQLDLTNGHVNWAGNGYRLPTESEWERASRGGMENAPYPWGTADGLTRANHWNYALLIGVAPSTDYPYLQRTGYFDGTREGGAPDMANAYGLYDMVGNAWEWTWDRMNAYTADPKLDPHGPDIGEFRVMRGGSWWNYIDQATNFQRLAFPPNGTDDYGMNGFRCVRGLHPNEAGN